MPAALPVCATSPTIVIDLAGQRRASSRQAISDSSCASSTITCPNVQVRSAAARSASGAVIRCLMACGQCGGVQEAGGGDLFVAGARGDVQHALGVGDPLRVLAGRARAVGPLVPPEKLGGLIEQRHVGGAPAAGLAQQRGALGRGQGGRRGGEPRRVGEQLVKQPARREGGPQVIQLGPHSRVRPQLAPQGREVHLLVLGAARDQRYRRQVRLDRLAGLGEDVATSASSRSASSRPSLAYRSRERGNDLPLEQRPGPVVREPGGPRPPGGLPHHLGVQLERLASELELGRAGGLPVTHGRREHVGHHGPPLDLLGEPGSRRGPPRPRGTVPPPCAAARSSPRGRAAPG